MLFEQALVLAILAAHDAKGQFVVAVAKMLPLRRRVDGVHETLGAVEGAVHNVDVVDFGAAEEEREADVPQSLGAGAEDGDGVNSGAAGEENRRGQGCPEGGEFGSSEKGIRGAGCREKGQGTDGSG